MGEPIWSIDGEATLQSVIERPDCPPLFRQTLTGPLSWQKRNEITVRRALATPQLASLWVAALLALGATVLLEREEGEQEVALEAALGHEVRGRMKELRVQPERPGRRWGQARVARTPADDPIVAAVAVVDLEGETVRQARVALIGAWPEPVRLAEAPARLVGRPLDEAHIREVAAAIEQEVAPRGDFLGSEAYRRAMAGVMARRALEQCAGR